MGKAVCDCFIVLCGQQSAEELIGVINSLTTDEAEFVNKNCNWSKAKRWAKWWLRPSTLKHCIRIFLQWIQVYGVGHHQQLML